MQEMTIAISDVLTIGALVTIITGFLTWTFKLYKEFNTLRTSINYRQDDIVLIFRSLRVLLETSIGRKENKDSLEETLEQLNKYIDTKASGLNVRNSPVK
jgi:CRISPR/Cas system CSM-associated protein Csm2 small subunit